MRKRLPWWFWSALSVAFFVSAMLMLEVEDGDVAGMLLSFAGGCCFFKANEEE